MRCAGARARSGRPSTRPGSNKIVSRRLQLCVPSRFRYDSEYVWLVGEQPLLVGWGHETATAVPLEPAALALTYRRPVADADSSLPVRSRNLEPVPACAPSQRASRSSSWATACLWRCSSPLALAVGRAASAGLLDPLPGTEWRLTWPAGCVAHAQNPLGGIGRAKSRTRTGFACPANRVGVTRLLSGRRLVRSPFRRDPMSLACHRVLMSEPRFKSASTGTATTISTWSSDVRPEDGSRRYTNINGTKVVATVGAILMQITR